MAIRRQAAGVPIVRPRIFPRKPGVLAAVSTRNGGVSPPPLGMNLSFRVGDREDNVRRNREIFFGSLGIRITELAIPGQVHGTRVLRVGEPGAYAECDALITGAARVFLCVSVADCVPILLCDPGVAVVGAVHAGWRGTAGRILEAAVRKMQADFGVEPRRLRAYIGPAASACCYTVGEEVASQFERGFVRRSGEGFILDLKRANYQQLHDTGVSVRHIEVSRACTISDSRRFHSHRRDGKQSGRMIAVIGLV